MPTSSLRDRREGVDERRGRSLPKPVRVLIGATLMVAVVAVALVMLANQAGRWGVPYFSYTTDSGTTCTNTWLGRTCEDLAEADFTEWTGFVVPAGTTVVTSSYAKVNSDFEVTAELRTSADHTEAVGKRLIERFGACQKGRLAPTEFEGHTDVCLVNSDMMRGTQDAPMTRRWNLATGVAVDGTRLTLLTFASR